MLLEKFDVKKYERSLREEGRLEERERINTLFHLLSEQNRIEDLIRATKDPAYQEELLREFDLL